MKLFKNWYWRGHWWFILIEAPKMKSLGGAVWPIVRMRQKDDEGTLKHEKSHLKSQLTMLVIPWLILYGIFHLLYGYNNNPFERYAHAIDNRDDEWRLYGFIKYLKKH